MKLDELTSVVKDTIGVRRVFAEPYERDGVTVIAAARTAGGGGGGGGNDSEGQQGEGGGFGVRSHPVGAYVIKNGGVTWRPAVDVNRLFAVVGAIAVAALLTRPRVHRVRIERPGRRIASAAKLATAKRARRR